MHTHTHSRTCAHRNTHSHARTHARTLTHTHTHTHTPHTHTHTHTHLTHTHTSHTLTHTETHAHTHPHKHTHSHTYTHTLTHTHSHTSIYTHHPHTTRTHARTHARTHTHTHYNSMSSDVDNLIFLLIIQSVDLSPHNILVVFISQNSTTRWQLSRTIRNKTQRTHSVWPDYCITIQQPSVKNYRNQLKHHMGKGEIECEICKNITHLKQAVWRTCSQVDFCCSNPNQTRLITYNQTDLGGMLPKSIVETALPSNMMNFFTLVKTAMKEDGVMKED